MKEELYYRDANGNLVLDQRKSNNMESITTEQSMLKIVVKLESMETNLDLKLEAVKDKISNLEEKVYNNFDHKDQIINDLTTKLQDHFEDDEIRNSSIDVIRSYKSNFDTMIIKVKDFDKRITILEQMPTVEKAKLVDELKDTVKKALFGAVAVTVIGFLGFLVSLYFKAH